MQNKDTNSRIRLLKVLEILKQTDEDHRLTIPDIQEKLKKIRYSLRTKSHSQRHSKPRRSRLSYLTPLRKSPRRLRYA